MNIYNDLTQISAQIGPVALAIGNFDGLHLGHQELIKEITNSTSLQSVVISFEPHPVQVLKPQIPFKRLFNFEDQIEQLKKFHVQNLVKLHFNKSIAELSYLQFLDLITSKLKISKMVVGYDFHFGKNKEGTIENLKKWCDQRQIEFVKINEVQLNGMTVSSTEIKRQIELSDLSLVQKMLARTFYLKGVVVKGDQRGRLLGFPTANMQVEEIYQKPKVGVYGTKTIVNGKTYASITNIGKTPTFKNDEIIKIETHILNFNEEIYGQEIEVHFLKYIRNEKKFSSIEEIKQQILHDIEESKK